MRTRLPFLRRERLAAAARIYATFGPEVRRERLRLGLSFLAALGGIAAELAKPWPIKLVFDAVLMPTPKGLALLPASARDLAPGSLVGLAAAGLLAVTLLGAALGYAQSLLGAAAGQRIAYRIRRRLYGHLLRLPLSFHEKARSGDLLLRLTGDVAALKEMLVPSLLDLASHAALLAGMIAVLLALSPSLAALALATIPLLALATTRFSGRLREAVRENRRREGQTASVAAESLASVALVQAFGREEFVLERFAARNRRSLKTGLKATRLETSLDRLVEIVLGLGTAAVLWVGARAATRGAMTAGDLLVVVAYLRSAYRPLRQSAKSLARIAKATASGERVLEILAAEPAIRDLPGAVAAPRGPGEVRFESVSLVHADGRRALDRLSLVLAPGEKVALVGPSGSGKSSLASLVPRLRDPSTGAVCLDGRDLRQLTLESLRARVTLVLQDSLLFRMTVRENLLFGDPTATESDIELAVGRAGASYLIGRLPHGLDSRLGERGATVSGGERQRLALARAALRDTPVVVLDEPFAGLDAATEEAVSRDLFALFERRTLLVVAHRLASIEGFDRIVVLDGGRIVGDGRHADLLQRCPLYRSLVAASRRGPVLGPTGTLG